MKMIRDQAAMGGNVGFVGIGGAHLRRGRGAQLGGTRPCIHRYGGLGRGRGAGGRAAVRAVKMVSLPDVLMGVGGTVAFALSAALGANDVANSLGTSVGTGAVGIGQALVIGAAMEFAGAVLFGSTVTQTISSGVVTVASVQPITFLLGMVCVLLGCTAWMAAATKYGLPVSSTHSVIGSLVGLGLVSGWGVNEQAIVSIVISWVLSPVAGGICAFVLYSLIKMLIIDSDQPARATRRYLPVLVSVTLFVLSLFLLGKGKGSSISSGRLLMISTGLAVAGFGITASMSLGIRSQRSRWMDFGVKDRPSETAMSQSEETEQIFMVLQVLTACLLAFSHGSNDVSNAIGPFAAMYTMYTKGSITGSVETPSWVLLLGGMGISAGLGAFGRPVMETVGKKITKLVPTKGFCVELGTALTVLVATKLGLPVSTTHTLIGCIVAIGLSTGDSSAVNVSVLRSIGASWVVTLPASALITVASFSALQPLLPAAMTLASAL